MTDVVAYMLVGAAIPCCAYALVVVYPAALCRRRRVIRVAKRDKERFCLASQQTEHGYWVLRTQEERSVDWQNCAATFARASRIYWELAQNGDENWFAMCLRLQRDAAFAYSVERRIRGAEDPPYWRFDAGSLIDMVQSAVALMSGVKQAQQRAAHAPGREPSIRRSHRG